MASSKRPKSNFQTHPSASSFQVSSQAYLQTHPDSPFGHIATGAVVFDSASTSELRILLLQRCTRDSWPNRWEIPGGACDDEDKTILHGAARELWEEAGLEASVVGPMIGEVQRFVSSSGKKIGKFVFAVEVAKRKEDGRAAEVKLDPNEHQDFVWASKSEVDTKTAGHRELEFTTTEAYNAILQAFEYSGRQKQSSRTSMV